VHVPLRSILPDGAFFNLDFSDPAQYENLLQDCESRLARYLSAGMQWNVDHGILTFVMNLLVPQANPMGRLLPRYDLRNIVYFVERLNQTLAAEVAKYQNAYLFDLDQIIASQGRQYVQDDVVAQINHNSIANNLNYPRDKLRIEGETKLFDTYQFRSHRIPALGWAELLAMYRTIMQKDSVKLVVTDIDDTIWRGIAAEQLEHDAEEMMAGWPRGYLEALSVLKSRGVLLALLSKNDEEKIIPIWKSIIGYRFPIDSFAVRKINWQPKAQNFEEILTECNLLPHNVVFIDDNPVERAAISSSFPGVRTFGSNPLLWRRILLWAPETQVARVTCESSRRTAMVQAQVEREKQRKTLSREEFLAALDIEIGIRLFSSVDHPGFPRALELINKSNQFNTTGRRWNQQECGAEMARGTKFYAFEVTDRFTSYGIVGVVVIHNAEIVQFVMSCRIVGMDVELAVISELIEKIARMTGNGVAAAKLKNTEHNLPARDLWSRCGFSDTGQDWRRPTSPGLVRPAHIKKLTVEEAETLFEPA
jgi:FkbH-like protein